MNDIYEKLTIFVNRMQKLGIKMELVSNVPWIYIDKINGKRVTEKYQANHGFTIAFLGVKRGSGITFTDLRDVFKLIRKYAIENVQ